MGILTQTWHERHFTFLAPMNQNIAVIFLLRFFIIIQVTSRGLSHTVSADGACRYFKFPAATPSRLLNRRCEYMVLLNTRYTLSRANASTWKSIEMYTLN